jgi:hypothetical protein
MRQMVGHFAGPSAIPEFNRRDPAKAARRAACRGAVRQRLSRFSGRFSDRRPGNCPDASRQAVARGPLPHQGFVPLLTIAEHRPRELAKYRTVEPRRKSPLAESLTETLLTANSLEQAHTVSSGLRKNSRDCHSEPCSHFERGEESANSRSPASLGLTTNYSFSVGSQAGLTLMRTSIPSELPQVNFPVELLNGLVALAGGSLQSFAI